MKATIKARPIIFSGEMVRAILAGKKTQTRRVVKPQPPFRGDRCEPSRIAGYWDFWSTKYPRASLRNLPIKCQFEPGMQLWVRESWAKMVSTTAQYAIAYKATGDGRLMLHDNYGEGDFIKIGGRCKVLCDDIRWNSPIYMPRLASRITLKVANVRMQCLNEISEQDAMDEGVTPKTFDVRPGHAYRECFADYWDSLNTQHPWKDNPWVWAITFEVV